MFVMGLAKRQSQDANAVLTPVSGMWVMDTLKSERLEWRTPADLGGTSWGKSDSDESEQQM